MDQASRSRITLRGSPPRLTIRRIIAMAVLTLLAGCNASVPGPTGVGATQSTGAASFLIPSASTPLPSSPGPTASPEPSQPSSPEPQPTYVPQPQPSLALVAAGSPAIPTKVRFDFLTQVCDLGPGQTCAWFRVGWLESNPAGATIRVYAVTTCLHVPTASAGKASCLETGDTIPEASLVLLGTAPAAVGTLSFRLDVGETFGLGFLPAYGPSVYAVVVQAVNAQGGSLFAFAKVTGSCYGCVL
jgi:hypothetical protein